MPDVPNHDVPNHESPKRATAFEPRKLDKAVIAIPLLEIIEKAEAPDNAGGPKKKSAPIPVIIDLNSNYGGGAEEGRAKAKGFIEDAVRRQSSGPEAGQGIGWAKSDLSPQYLFATLEPEVIREIARLDGQTPPGVSGTTQTRSIFRIWPDFPVKALITKSVCTVKADAARTSFAASGKDIVWAVVDSGINQHSHFALHKNLDLTQYAPLAHQDFTEPGNQPLNDECGHGTHVAGIIAGEMDLTGGKRIAFSRQRTEEGEVAYAQVALAAISGMAPQCALLSLKVLDKNGDGLASNLIAAIAYVQKINSYGRAIRIHGVNMSVGYSFDPEWFACGQSPLCVEVNRLVRSGVVVVVAAGNTGYGWLQSQSLGPVAAGMDLTINDPGNAEYAITVGSTHRDEPHIYGVSYFSSKGPTGDGRMKPDLVAPGEKILSCAAGLKLQEAQEKGEGVCDYLEDSGTSMAAPHVSGVIAAFLSIRGEYKGRPDEVKEIFLSSATDLKRERMFQGHGLVDLMRAIQSV